MVPEFFIMLPFILNEAMCHEDTTCEFCQSIFIISKYCFIYYKITTLKYLKNSLLSEPKHELFVAIDKMEECSVNMFIAMTLKVCQK